MSVRANEAQRIVELVHRGTSVEVVGLRWSGRSEVLLQVRAALTELGHNVVSVVGTASPSPMEALRVALPPAYRRAAADEGGTLASISDALARFVSSEQSVVVIDDADLLDDASWSSLIQLHRRTACPIVASTLRRAPAGSNEHRLSKAAQPVVQISLEPLRLDALHALLEERVAGSLAPSVSARIFAESAGTPGLAVALLEGAISQGLVWRSGDQWIAGPTLWSEVARGAYESVLYSYRPEIRDALELLAAVGTVDVPAAWLLLGTEIVEELEGDQLVRVAEVGADRQAVVAVHPPGLVTYFLNQPPSARRLRILDRAAERLEQGNARLDAVSRAILLEKLRPGASPQAEKSATSNAFQLTDVPVISRMFVEAFDVQIAAARAEWQRSGSPRSAAIYLGLLLTGPGDAREIELLLEGVSQRFYGGSDDHEAELALRHYHSRWLLAQGASVDEALGPLTQRIPAGFDHDEALDTLARVTRWEFEGLDPEYEAVLAPRLEGGGLDADIAGVLLAACHVMSGKIEEGLALIDRRQGDSRAWSGAAVVLLRGLTMYASGELPDLVEAATIGLQESIASLDRLAFACHSYLGALAQLTLGESEKAQDALAILFSTGISSKALYFTPDRAVLMLMAVIANRSGHRNAASSYMAYAQQIRGASNAILLGNPGWAEASSAVASGAPETAASIFADITRDAREHGFHLSAGITTLASLYVHYDPELATQVVREGERLGGEMFAAILEARASAHARDAERLETAARALVQQGLLDEAVKHYNLAAHVFKEQGELERASAARDVARDISDANAQSQRHNRSRLLLTAREMEIVQLIATGMSNGGIAERLVLSVRTVENHVRNIRRKTGATSRSEIVVLAATGTGKR